MSSGEKTESSSSSNVNQTSEGKPKAKPHASSCTPFEPTPGSRTCEPSHVTENGKFKMPSVDEEKESDVKLTE